MTPSKWWYPYMFARMQRIWNKNAIWDVKSMKWGKWCINFPHFLINNCFFAGCMLPMVTKYRNHVFYVWLVDLQTISDKYGLETWFSPNEDIVKCWLDIQFSWTKNAFWHVSNKKCRKWCKISHLFYLITLMAYLCSQWTPNVQMKYFKFDWSICRTLCYIGPGNLTLYKW
jgi:hypothetical protein